MDFDRLFIDKKFRLPRIWSNRELKKFAHLFKGDVINVSGWKDIDKEGGHYKDYFNNARSYTISNFKAEARGLQGIEDELFLDLTKDIPNNLVNKFDVAFNHTTLEHVYNIKKALENICLLSKDIVILVVPFLQPMHGDYGDFWRFSPSTIKKMFEENGLTFLYLSFNNHKKASVYIFAIASKNPKKWQDEISNKFDYNCKKERFDPFENYIGCRAITNNWFYKIKFILHTLIKKIKR